MAIDSEVLKAAVLSPLMQLWQPAGRGVTGLRRGVPERVRRTIALEANDDVRGLQAVLDVDRVVTATIAAFGSLTDDDGTLVAALPGLLVSIDDQLRQEGRSLFLVSDGELADWMTRAAAMGTRVRDFYSTSDPEIDQQIAAYDAAFDVIAAGSGATKMAAFIAAAGTESENVYNADLMLTGYALLIEATIGDLSGDGDIADDAVTYIEDLIDEAINVTGGGNPFGDGGTYKDWPVSGGDTLTDGSSMLNDFKGTQAMSRICALVKNNATLNTELGSRVDTIITFLQTHIVTKWLAASRTKSGLAAITWVRTVHTLTPDATHGYMQDLQLAVLDVCWNLHLAGVTGDILDSSSTSLAEFVAEVWASLKTNVLDDATFGGIDPLDGTLVWHNGNYLWSSAAATKVPDTNHFGRLPRFLVEYYRGGTTAVLPYITALGKTFSQKIFNGQLDVPSDLSQAALEAGAAPATRNYIDGQDLIYSTQRFQGGSPAGMAGQPNDGWHMLGAYSRDSYFALEAIYRHVTASTGNTNALLLRQRSAEYRIGLLGALAFALAFRTW